MEKLSDESHVGRIYLLDGLLLVESRSMTTTGRHAAAEIHSVGALGHFHVELDLHSFLARVRLFCKHFTKAQRRVRLFFHIGHILLCKRTFFFFDFVFGEEHGKEFDNLAGELGGELFEVHHAFEEVLDAGGSAEVC